VPALVTLGILIWSGLARAADPPAIPLVVGVDLVSPHRLPEARVRGVLGDLVGRPRLRGAVRQSLERLWSLGLFTSVRVEELEEAGGVRLLYHLMRRPYVEEIRFEGDLGLPRVDLASAAAVAVGSDATFERLERARASVEELLEREGFRNARVALAVRSDEATNGRHVTIEVEAGERARVGTVEIRGLSRGSPAVVRKALGLDTGDRFRDRAYREGIATAQERLRREGFPQARVTAAPSVWDAATNRIDLALEVEEGPRLRTEFTGNKAIKAAELRERLTFAATGTVDDAEVRSSVRQVETAYREKGYAFVTAGGTLQHEGDDLVVRIHVDEGTRVTVEAVEFPGASTVSPARLARTISTQPSSLIRRTPYVEDTTQRDAVAVAAFLRAQGLAEAKVGAPRATFSEDRTKVTVAFPIEEGPLLRIGQIEIDGAVTLTPDTLRSGLPLKTGAPWSEVVMEEGRRALERRYARLGYHATSIEPTTTRNDSTVDVRYQIFEGPQTRIGRILIGGLTETHEDVVRRELPFAVNDPLDPENLLEAQRRLIATGVFERVDVEPLRPPPEPFADVEITVREGKPWYLEVGGGYNEFEGVRAFLEVGHDNLFGMARSLRLRLRVSQRGDREELIYRVPWVLGTRWALEANPFREYRQEIGYDIIRIGVSLGIQRDLFTTMIKGLRGDIVYSIAHVDRFHVDESLATAGVVDGTDIVATITPGLILDRRDRVLDPRRGSFHLASVRVGAAPLGSDVDFVKARLETAWFFDWPPPTVIAVGARLGLAAPFASSTSIPVEERFFAGGASTVRGYREQRLGPIDANGNPTGGNAQLILNLEYRFPIWRWLSGAVFVDAGNVFSEVRDLSVAELRVGTGGGFRIVTPVGPVRLDIGYPLVRQAGQEQKVRYHFSVGYPF
jgi:outer membrane protein insertion porin family